ncbi:MAG: polysaccharide deacetylase family protein [Caldisericaceae bacterium]
MKKRFCILLVVSLLLVQLPPKVVASNSLTSDSSNPSASYFEGLSYDIGRVYGLTLNSQQKSELIAIQQSIRSPKDTICIILMYHNFYSTGGPKGNCYIKLEDFENNLKILQKYNFKSISIEDLYDFMKYDKKIPARSVILTFDDGFKSFMNAYPIIKKYGYGGVVSLISGYVGSVWELSYDQIEELSKGGIEFASHTSKIHNNFKKFIDEKKFSIIANDVQNSRKYFNDVLHIDTIAFTYPWGVGSSVKEVREILTKNGFYVGFDTWKRRVNKYGDDPLSAVRTDISEGSGYNNQKKFEQLIKDLLPN